MSIQQTHAKCILFPTFLALEQHQPTMEEDCKWLVFCGDRILANIGNRYINYIVQTHIKLKEKLIFGDKRFCKAEM